jgi:hypothetical protein
MTQCNVSDDLHPYKNTDVWKLLDTLTTKHIIILSYYLNSHFSNILKNYLCLINEALGN